MITRDPDASFDTPNVVIGRQGRNELTLSFRPAPYLHRLLARPQEKPTCSAEQKGAKRRLDQDAANADQDGGAAAAREQGHPAGGHQPHVGAHGVRPIFDRYW